MTLNEQKRVVSRFLRQCNRYADGKLADYAARLAAADPAESAALQARIGQWESYREFNLHALGELDTDRLDAWFEEQPAGPSGTK